MPDPRRAAALTSLLAVAGVLLGVLLVAWAATVGPGEVLTGPGPRASSSTSQVAPAPTTDPTAESEEEQRARAERHPVAAEFTKILLTVALALALLAPVVALVRAAIAARTLQPRFGRGHPADVVLDPLAAPEALQAALADDLPAHVRLLSKGPVGPGIIGCWQRFQATAEAHGVPRRPAETSSEFTRRVLESLATDGDAVGRLGRLYREARFSDHVLTEDHRRAALDAVRRIQASLAPAGSSA